MRKINGGLNINNKTEVQRGWKHAWPTSAERHSNIPTTTTTNLGGEGGSCQKAVKEGFLHKIERKMLSSIHSEGVGSSKKGEEKEI